MIDPLPKARTSKLIRRELESEIIFYDLEHLKAGCLNSLATKVLNHCDGSRTPAQISEAIGQEEITEQEVHYVLERLSKAKLLEPGYRPPETAFEGTSRRSILAKLATSALPLVTGIAVPTWAVALSCFGQCHDCNVKEDCCPGLNCTSSAGHKRCVRPGTTC
jgi:hypothetical protein